MKKANIAFLLIAAATLASACGEGSKTSSSNGGNSSTIIDNSSTEPTPGTSSEAPGPGTSSEAPGPGTSSSEEPKTKEFRMEAEYTDLWGKPGAGYSGSADNLDHIFKDRLAKDGWPEHEQTNADASNGYWVGGCSLNECNINFIFNSDVAVTGATLVLRLSTEFMDITLTPEVWEVRVNQPLPKSPYDAEDDLTDDDGLEYGEIVLDGAVTDITIQEKRPFTDHVLPVKIDIKEGKNQIDLVTDNTTPMVGTMYATAPLIDCIMIQDFGDANLTWDPLIENLEDL